MRFPHRHDEKVIEHGQHDERQKFEDDIGENVEDLLVQLMLAKVRVEHLNDGVLFGNSLEIELGFSGDCGANSQVGWMPTENRSQIYLHAIFGRCLLLTFVQWLTLPMVLQCTWSTTRILYSNGVVIVSKKQSTTTAAHRRCPSGMRRDWKHNFHWIRSLWHAHADWYAFENDTIMYLFGSFNHSISHSFAALQATRPFLFIQQSTSVNCLLHRAHWIGMCEPCACCASTWPCGLRLHLPKLIH